MTDVGASNPESRRAVQPISLAAVRTAIDAAEPELEWCCSIVSCLANHTAVDRFGDAVLKFQVRLLDTIEKLEVVYRRIKQEEKRLTARRLELNARWFSQRMKQLDRYTVAVRRVLVISRALGDGFAWYFYERDRKLIDEHLKHQRQPLLPPGIGALGERLTLENLQVLEGQFLLYHGITTFLRMGDISLIDLKEMRVASIGELKSQRRNANTVETRVSLTATGVGSFPRIKGTKKPSAQLAVPLLPAMEDRRRRQATALLKALDVIDQDNAIKINAKDVDFHFEALDTVVEKCGHAGFSWVKASNGFVLGAMRTGEKRDGTLSDNLLDKGRDPASRVSDVPEWAMKVLDSEIEQNSLIIGAVCGEDDDFVAPSISFPVALWPISLDTLTDLFLGRVIVISFFNPAHLWHSLAADGFAVSYDKRGDVKVASKRVGDKELVLENLEWFKRLIVSFLMTESCVRSLIDQLIGFSKGDYGPQARIELKPVIHRHYWKSRKPA